MGAELSPFPRLGRALLLELLDLLLLLDLEDVHLLVLDPPPLLQGLRLFHECTLKGGRKMGEEENEENEDERTRGAGGGGGGGGDK